MLNQLTKALFTIVLDYKNNNYIYQFWAKNEKEAKLHWAKEINLKEIGVQNIKKIRDELVTDALEEDFYPSPAETPIGKLQSVWDMSTCSFGDEQNIAVAYIIATVPMKKNCKFNEDRNSKQQKLFSFKEKNKYLYTIQLDYKGGSYSHQVFASNPLDAKIKWIKEFDLSVVYGVPKNIIEIKETLLSLSTIQDFIPNSVEGKESVWSTLVQLGDETGRVTIVATQIDLIV